MVVKNVEKKDNNTAIFQVEVDADSFEKAVNTAYKKLKNSIYVAGFRKGKAPRVVIEGMYGADIFHDEAVQDMSRSSPPRPSTTPSRRSPFRPWAIRP